MSAQSPSVIVSGARTPMGRLLGSLSGLSASDLGGAAIKAALERSGITGEQVDYVIMGQVIQAGSGQNAARPAAVNAGIPMSVPAVTINKVCLSGLDAIALADQLIRAGEFQIVVAGGMESMTNAPHLLTLSSSLLRRPHDCIHNCACFFRNTRPVTTCVGDGASWFIGYTV